MFFDFELALLGLDALLFAQLLLFLLAVAAFRWVNVVFRQRTQGRSLLCPLRRPAQARVVNAGVCGVVLCVKCNGWIGVGGSELDMLVVYGMRVCSGTPVDVKSVRVGCAPNGHSGLTAIMCNPPHFNQSLQDCESNLGFGFGFELGLRGLCFAIPVHDVVVTVFVAFAQVIWNVNS